MTSDCLILFYKKCCLYSSLFICSLKRNEKEWEKILRRMAYEETEVGSRKRNIQKCREEDFKKSMEEKKISKKI